MQTGLEGKPWYVGLGIGVVIGGLLLFLAHRMYLSNMERQIKGQEKKKAELQQQIAEGEAARAQLPQFQERVRRLELDLEKLLRILPDRRNVHELIRQFRAIAEREDFDLIKFSPKPEVEKEFFNEWPMQLTVEGTYHALARFFDRMSRFSRIINIETLRLQAERGDPSKTLQASFTAKTFVYKETEELPEDAAAGAGAAPGGGRPKGANAKGDRAGGGGGGGVQ
jgi:type IV pilus assembly protein PilO